MTAVQFNAGLFRHLDAFAKDVHHLMLLVPVALSLASCVNDGIDNPVAPSGPEADKYAFTDEMDLSVAPGDDFYQYVLGTWLDENPQSQVGLKGTMTLQGQLGLDWLKSILNTNSPDPVVAHLFSLVENAAAEHDANIADLHAKTDAIAALESREDVLRAMGQMTTKGYAPIFNIGMQGNRENMLLVIGGEPFDKEMIQEQLEAMEYTEEEIDRLMTLCVDFFKNSPDDQKVKFTDMRYWFNPENVRKLIPYQEARARAATRGETAASDIILEGIGVEPALVELTDKYSEQLLDQIEELSVTAEGLEQLKGAMQLAMVRRDAPFIQIFNKDDLVELMTDYSFHSLNYQLSKLYCEANLTAADREYVVNMCEEFRSTMAARIDRLDWMSDATKARAQKKLQAVRFISGYDEWDDSYILPAPTSAKTLFEALDLLEEQYLKLQTEKLLGPGTPEKILAYFMLDSGSWIANAFYSPNYNYCYILGSNLIAPICDLKLGDAYNYAVIGATTIGHELTHGFDSDGANYDGMGVLTDWWEAADKAAFEEKQQQLIDHFNAYEAVPGHHLNGENTITENIADLGGLEMGLEIITDRCQKEGFSPEALDEQIRAYLLSYAYGWKSNDDEKWVMWQLTEDVHSPNRWRTNAQVNQIDKWYSLFNVTPDQKLYVASEKRVKIW
jgi:putative endopeptidase